eukprot:15358657-Ditylum_brightwellii.AAC.2
MMAAVCAFVMPVLQGAFGIMKWTRAELRKLDVKTRKMLMTYGFHYPKSSVHILYFHRLRGGRGLTGVEETHDCECSGLADYLIESNDVLTRVVQEMPIPTQKFLMKFAFNPSTTPSLSKQCTANALYNKRRCPHAEKGGPCHILL